MMWKSDQVHAFTLALWHFCTTVCSDLSVMCKQNSLMLFWGAEAQTDLSTHLLLSTRDVHITIQDAELRLPPPLLPQGESLGVATLNESVPLSKVIEPELGMSKRRLGRHGKGMLTLPLSLSFSLFLSPSLSFSLFRSFSLSFYRPLFLSFSFSLFLFFHSLIAGRRPLRSSDLTAFNLSHSPTVRRLI